MNVQALGQLLDNLMNEFQKNYPEPYQFTGNKESFTLKKLVSVLQKGLKNVNEIDGIGIGMIHDLNNLLTLEKLFIRVDLGTFKLDGLTVLEQERLTRMGIRLQEHLKVITEEEYKLEDDRVNSLPAVNTFQDLEPDLVRICTSDQSSVLCDMNQFLLVRRTVRENTDGLISQLSRPNFNRVRK